MEVSVKKIEPDACLPQYGSLHSAGFDIPCYEDIVIPPHSRIKVRTGIAIGWSDPTVYLQIQSRSGLFYNHGISCEAGVIDWDYLKEIFVLLQNHTDITVSLSRNSRVAQGIFVQQPAINCWKEVNDWISPGRLVIPYGHLLRQGGLGSTGV
jgi:dUTP pyrophosphatase